MCIHSHRKCFCVRCGGLVGCYTIRCKQLFCNIVTFSLLERRRPNQKLLCKDCGGSVEIRECPILKVKYLKDLPGRANELGIYDNSFYSRNLILT